jgi:hypothetical protein
MSQPNQTPVIPDPRTAYNTLFNEVHARVFFQKCAAYGFAPTTEPEAQVMLETAAKLRAYEERTKTASAPRGGAFAADAMLDRVLAQEGYNDLTKQAAVATDELMSFAAEAARDPQLYNAVLSIKAAEAEQYMQARA